ncbi:hypothetical protein THRCLA_09197, partial [Thraustotheca clavata]
MTQDLNTARANVYEELEKSLANIEHLDVAKIESVAGNFAIALHEGVFIATPMPYPELGDNDVVRLVCSPLPLEAAALARRIGEKIAAIFQSDDKVLTYVNTQASMHITLFHTSHPDASQPFSEEIRANEITHLHQLASTTKKFELNIHSVVIASSGTVLMLFDDPSNSIQTLRYQAKAAFGEHLRHPSHIVHSTLSRILSTQIPTDRLLQAQAHCHQLTQELRGQVLDTNIKYNSYILFLLEQTDGSSCLSFLNLPPSTHMSVQIADLPVIDLAKYMANREQGGDQCRVVAECLYKYGVLVVRDPRATEDDNNTFVDMMERYFEQTDFKQDARPEYSYQVGVTPEHLERARNHCNRAETLDEAHRPVTLCPPELDKKSRFFWRTGPRPPKTQFTELNAEPVIPKAFPEWENTMDMWGNKMLAAVHELVEMAAIGLRLEKDAFQKRMTYGPHLLAPTGSNFNKYGNLNDVLAGYHYDLNLLTIHGKSRFRGLYIWLRNGEKALVRVPDGCLLVQAGKQIEYLT